MKSKKRKNFITVLLPRIIAAWIIAFLIGTFTIDILYYLSNSLYETRNTEMVDFVEESFNKRGNIDDEGITRIYNLYLSGVMQDVKNSDLPDSFNFINTKQYACLYDSNSDKIFMESSQKMFTSLPFVSDESDENVIEGHVYTCDLDYLTDLNLFKEIIDENNKNTDSIREWFGKKPYVEYEITVKEIWYDYKNKTFLPIKGEVIKRTYANKAGARGGFNTKSTVEKIPYDLSLHFEEYKDNYKSYIPPENVYKDTFNVWLMGTSESDEKYIKKVIEEDLKSDVLKDEYKGGIISKPNALSNRNRIYLSSRKLSPKDGNIKYFYICVQENIFETYKGLWIFIWTVSFIVSSLIAVVFARMYYSKLQYFYRNEDYRIALLNSLVHDLKTPLTVMSGYAENLRENIQSENGAEYADGILQNTGYINNIIEDVIELSFSEKSNRKIKKEKTDLVALFKESEEALKKVIEEKKLKIEYGNAFNRRVERKAMKRVCDNLLGNAVKYTKDGGIIKIYGTDKPFCHYFAMENAPIAPIGCKPQKLWEPFVKGDESRSDVSGNGLGLAISKNILEKNKLKAAIKVKEDKFTIRIR